MKINIILSKTIDQDDFMLEVYIDMASKHGWLVNAMSDIKSHKLSITIRK